MSYLMLVEEVSWSWSRAGEQRVGLLIQRPGFLCRRVKPLDGVGKAEAQGGVLLGDSQLHLHQEDSVGGGGGSGLFL